MMRNKRHKARIYPRSDGVVKHELARRNLGLAYPTRCQGVVDKTVGGVG